jgi:hypothetical protein
VQLPFAVAADDSVEIACCRDGIVIVRVCRIGIAGDDVENIDTVDLVIREVGSCERGKCWKEVDGAEGLVGNAACRS